MRVTGGAGLSLLLLLAWTAAPAAPDQAIVKIDRYLRTEMRRQHIPGLSLAIIRNGTPLYLKGYGVATLEHPVTAAPDTVYQIGSIGKQFTATAVMLLAQDHKLDLDDPLSKYLPEIPPSWSAITLRLILNHQSGIAQFTTPGRQLLDLRHDYTDTELIQLAIGQPLDFVPGNDVSYSDTGYVLLGFVINRIIGGFYGDFLQERVFGPLGMSHTRIISDADIVRNRASGYELDDHGTLRNQTPVSPALNRTADGSLYSTVLDLLKWDRALDRGTILPRRQLERMWMIDVHHDGNKPLYHYGYGWENNRLAGHRLIEYDGNWQGFQAVMSRYENDGLTVVILTNLALCRTERLSHSVAGLVDPALRPYAETLAGGDPAPELTADFRRFLAAAADRSPDVSMLTDAARGRLVPSTLTTLQRELQELGPIRRYGLVRSAIKDAGVERVYRVEGADMVDFFTVSYTPDRRVDDLDLFREY